MAVGPGRNFDLDRLTAVQSLVVVGNTRDEAIQDGTKGRAGHSGRSDLDNHLRIHASGGNAIGLDYQIQEAVEAVGVIPESCCALLVLHHV
jgi:hypothetical protein